MRQIHVVLLLVMTGCAPQAAPPAKAPAQPAPVAAPAQPTAEQVAAANKLAAEKAAEKAQRDKEAAEIAEVLQHRRVTRAAAVRESTIAKYKDLPVTPEELEAFIEKDIAVAAYKEQDNEEAILRFKASIKAKPMPANLNQLAIVYYNIGEKKLARSAAADAIKLSPDDEEMIKLYQKLLAEETKAD